MFVLLWRVRHAPTCLLCFLLYHSHSHDYCRAVFRDSSSITETRRQGRAVAWLDIWNTGNSAFHSRVCAGLRHPVER